MKQWMRAAWRRFAGLGRVGRLAAAVYGGAMALMVAWAVWAWEDIDPAKPIDELTYLVCVLFAVAAPSLRPASARVADDTAGSP